MRALAVLVVATVLPSLAGEAIDEAQRQSQKQLDASLAELVALREQIAEEKLPLARRVGELEQRLVELRKQNDQTIRQIDQGGFDDSKLESQVKLREDEAAYVANLADEYVRSFEGKLGVGEAERYGPLVASAKEAVASGMLNSEEKIERQLPAIKASISRLEDVVGGTRFSGAAVDPQGVLASGTFALIGPVALFAAADGSAAGIAVPQTGSAMPAVRSVDERIAAAVSAVVREGRGALPLDASRGGALEALIQRTSIVHVFKKGGPIMWPLLFVSVLASATVLERVVFLARERSRRDVKAMSKFLEAVEHGRFEEAVEASRATRDYVVRSLAYALSHREKSLPSALLYANAKEIKRFTRGVPILDTSITIAPLLGLLGTVTGMMGSFSLLGGELSAPAAITGGIAEALIATAFGLGIAIVALVPYNYLNNQTEEVRHELEAASAQLELLARPWLEHGRPAAPVLKPNPIESVA
jgi:biopolymer transport protein ExbB